MKTVIIATVLLLSLGRAGAQVSRDSLVVSFKSGERVTIALADIQKITFDTATAAVHGSIPTANFQVSQNFPNPLQTETSIDFELTEGGSIMVAIYDSKGNIVRLIAIPNAQSGHNRLGWDGRDQSGVILPSGPYFYEVRFKDKIQVKQMVIVR